MDVAPRVDQLMAKAVNEQLSEQRLIRKALQAVGQRLERLESTTAALEEKIRPWSDPSAATADLALRVEKRFAKRFAALEARIEQLTEVAEERAVDALYEDIEEVSEELQKSVAELARQLVRDRSRIANALTEHRNAILAELRLPPTNGRTINLAADEVIEEQAVGSERAAPRILRRLRVN